MYQRRDVRVKCQTGEVRSKKTAATAQIQSFENTIDCVRSRQYLGAEDKALYSNFSSNDDVDVDSQSSRSTLDPAPDVAVIVYKTQTSYRQGYFSKENDLLKADNIHLKASLDKLSNQMSSMISFFESQTQRSRRTRCKNAF